jgi:hypothetical protein
MPQTALMRLFNFTADDLAANSEGRFSEAQHAALKKRFATDMRTFIYSMIAALIFVGTLVCLLGILVVGVLSSQQMATTVGFLLAILVAAFMGYAVRERYLTWEKLLNTKEIAHACGAATKYNTITRTGAVYRITISGQPFRMNRLQFAAFQEEREYCIHYTPLMRIILSIEEK